MGRKEFELIKEILRPSGFGVQMYTYNGMYHVRVQSPSGATLDPGVFEEYDRADVYFTTLTDTLSDAYYS